MKTVGGVLDTTIHQQIDSLIDRLLTSSIPFVNSLVGRGGSCLYFV